MKTLALSILLFFATTVCSGTNPPAPGLDAKVQAFLDAHRNEWSSGHFPDSDGRMLFDLIVKNKYTRVVEIGTGSGHSSIWLAWALSKTGGKLITIEIREDRYQEAVALFKETGLAGYIDARLADAHVLLGQLRGPFDFVFMDAVIGRDFFDEAAPKIAVGGCFLTHGVRNGEPAGYVSYLKSLKNFETTFGAGFCTSFKKAEQ